MTLIEEEEILNSNTIEQSRESVSIIFMFFYM